MIIKITEKHPFHFVKDIVDNNPGIESLEIAYYSYKKQSVVDDRKIIKIPREKFNLKFISRSIEYLKPKTELAIQSRVYMIDGSVMQIPMVDFHGELIGFGMNQLSKVLNSNLFDSFEFYLSGRSYHAYSNSLMTNQDWFKFMYKLLLINPPGKAEIIDTRWIGHRLLAGYGALRWSWKTGQYKQSPYRVSKKEMLEKSKSLTTKTPQIASIFD